MIGMIAVDEWDSSRESRHAIKYKTYHVNTIQHKNML